MKVHNGLNYQKKVNTYSTGSLVRTVDTPLYSSYDLYKTTSNYSRYYHRCSIVLRLFTQCVSQHKGWKEGRTWGSEVIEKKETFTME